MTMHSAAPGTLEASGYRERDLMAVTEVQLAPDLPNDARFLDTSFAETRRLRHDGWDGAKMARFCETLAETGVVTEACRAAGMSAQSAYALRHRDPVFAAAWRAALAMGRERLADDLLARAMKGEVVQVWQNGAIVAERHRFDNKLALAILRRLDKLANSPSPLEGEGGARSAQPSGRGRRVQAAQNKPPLTQTPALNGGWSDLLQALEQDRPQKALDLLGRPETDEVDDPPVPTLEAHERAELERLRTHFREQEEESADHRRQGRLETHIRFDESTASWRTSFPPPHDFVGKEEGAWGEEDYERDCSPHELRILIDQQRLARERQRSQEEADRDFYFVRLATLMTTTAVVPPRSEFAASVLSR